MRVEADPGAVAGSGPADPLEPVLFLSELAARLGVSVQTPYGLRSQGCGPGGFHVGRELRFWLIEIEPPLSSHLTFVVGSAEP